MMVAFISFSVLQILLTTYIWDAKKKKLMLWYTILSQVCIQTCIVNYDKVPMGAYLGTMIHEINANTIYMKMCVYNCVCSCSSLLQPV